MDRLEQYEKFFKLQRRDQEKKYELYANTSLNSLFEIGRAFYGSIVGTTEHGQMVIQSWNCTSLKFRENFNVHTSFSDIVPLYFLSDRKTVGCSKVSLEMLNAVRSGLAQHKELRFVMLETLPPTELLMNLSDYISQIRISC